MNLIRSLYLAAALLTVAGLGLQLAPPGRLTVAPPAAPAARNRNRSAPLADQAATGEIDSGAADQIISANIFARSRVAPPRAIVRGIPAGRTEAPSPRLPTFKLYGTTIGPQGAVALIDANSAPGGAQMHQIGDMIAGARLVTITDSTVELDRPSGPLILRLPPTARETP